MTRPSDVPRPSPDRPGLDLSAMARRLANGGAGYLFDSSQAVADVTALLCEVGRLGIARYAAYEQGHRDACADPACVPRPDPNAAICGLSGNYGPLQEPLACGYPRGHDGPHAWASLPTFVDGKPVTS